MDSEFAYVSSGEEYRCEACEDSGVEWLGEVEAVTQFDDNVNCEGFTGVRFEEMGARDLATLSSVSDSSVLSAHGSPWMVCHACMAFR